MPMTADQRLYIDVFSKAIDQGHSDERAHRLAWTMVEKHGTHNQKTHGKRGGRSKPGSSGGSSSGGPSGGPRLKTGTMGAGRDQGRGLKRSSKRPKTFDPNTKTPGTGQRVGELVAAGITTALLLDAARTVVRAAPVAARIVTKAAAAGPASPAMVLKVIQLIAQKLNIDEDKASELLVQALQKKTNPKEQAVPFGKHEDTIEAETYVEFSKVDEDKRQVFGWAIVAKDADGNDVIDLQGDMVSPDEVEKAAYDYVIHSRDGGEMHVRKGVSRMIESMVISPEKLEAMGIVKKGDVVKANGIPIGWWVGFEVTDDGVWKGVKEGKYTGFSIHGMGKRQVIGKREDIEKAQLLRKRAMDLLGQAVARGDDQAVEELTKHLIGRHSQKSHGRREHQTKEGARAGAEAGALLGATAGFLTGGVLPGAVFGTALGGTAGAVQGAKAGGREAEMKRKKAKKKKAKAARERRAAQAAQKREED